MIEELLKLVNKIIEMFSKERPEPEEDSELDKFHKIRKENPEDKTVYWREK